MKSQNQPEMTDRHSMWFVGRSPESNSQNNFSISTDELAESLQRSVATLKVAGNDLDEAIALTVAGNDILRDPDSVGSGLKTIALRIQGKIIALTYSNVWAFL